MLQLCSTVEILLFFIFFSFLKGLKSPPESLSDLGAIESLRVPGKVLLYMSERDFLLPEENIIAFGY